MSTLTCVFLIAALNLFWAGRATERRKRHRRELRQALRAQRALDDKYGM